jgi:hypothetical protein
MSPRSPYSWYPAYIAAAFETDFARLYERIDVALKEIEERLDGPRKLDTAEYHEIQEALRALQQLSTDEARTNATS